MLHDGYNFKYDVSIPVPHLYSLVQDVRQRLSDIKSRVVGYGHIGDG